MRNEAEVKKSMLKHGYMDTANTDAKAAIIARGELQATTAVSSSGLVNGDNVCVRMLNGSIELAHVDNGMLVIGGGIRVNASYTIITRPWRSLQAKDTYLLDDNTPVARLANGVEVLFRGGEFINAKYPYTAAGHDVESVSKAAMLLTPA